MKIFDKLIMYISMGIGFIFGLVYAVTMTLINLSAWGLTLKLYYNWFLPLAFPDIKPLTFLGGLGIILVSGIVFSRFVGNTMINITSVNIMDMSIFKESWKSIKYQLTPVLIYVVLGFIANLIIKTYLL